MNKRTWWLNALLLVLVAALAYLPLVNQIGYTHDDWYLMATASSAGADVFHPIYSVDRPLRAYVLQAAYTLFGGNALLYNLSAWAFRVVSALMFLWLLDRLWPGRSRWTFLMALFYLVYPGFLFQLNGIDYQSQILSLALAMFSLALTVYSIYEVGWPFKVGATILAIASGVLYLGLVEYEAGFELIRLLILFVLTGRAVKGNRERILATVKAWLPYSLILLGFGTWRFFFFDSERAATDATVQLEHFRLYPVQTIFHWIVQIVQDLFEVLLLAWAIPLAQLTGYIQAWGGLIASLVAALILWFFLKETGAEPQSDSPADGFSREALWLGLLSAVAGLIPIAMVNREVAFPAFSRYALVSSVGAAIFLAAVLYRLSGRYLRGAILAGLLLIALLTHHANSVRFARETAALRNFWWQVAWRVPNFEKNTTLVANVPGVATEEDYFVWGPASLIYYPEKQNPKGIQPGLFAAILNRDTVLKVLTRERQEFDNRKHIITYKNYRNIVILTQPSQNSCVHVLDGAHPEFSRTDPDSIRVIGAYSEMEHILTDPTYHAPPEIVFGPEPARGWCYYYQKADLARQKGDWDEVIRIEEQAAAQNFAPADLIEWMPFLQAHAATGNLQRLQELAPAIRGDPYISLQACRILNSTLGVPPHVVETASSLYCLE